jgi:hypothetical protein
VLGQSKFVFPAARKETETMNTVVPRAVVSRGGSASLLVHSTRTGQQIPRSAAKFLALEATSLRSEG